MTAQLSPLRTGRITGSRVAAILGESKYATAADVLREMVRQHHGAEPEFTGNDATEHGQAHEPDAITAYEQERFVTVHSQQEIVVHPEHDFLAVTPDGLVGEDGMIEVKCPFRAGYTTLPDHYRPQVMLQLAVTGRAWCDFVVWREGEPLLVQRVAANPGWLPAVLPRLVEFVDLYRATIADPEASRPHLEPLVVNRADSDWQAAASRFHVAQVLLDDAKATYEEARQRLLTLADGRASQGAGVSVSYVQRAGAVDWARVAERYAPDVDPEEFRKPGSTVATVRTVQP